MTMSDLYSKATQHSDAAAFDPTRRAGLERLEAFAPRAGLHYAAHRNYDFGPTDRSTVSVLSPWIKHRLLTEEEVLSQTLARHGLSASMKYVQEVFWRGYFKGWLEQHPSVWSTYQAGRKTAFEALEGNTALKTDYLEAIEGRTGIACFNHWVTELKSTGYLHNHARMWFASIWIFTLRLPWELGAHFFMCHLIDGDAASNTLSWRWVGGLHTKGKTYLASSSNIAEFTGGRFEPEGQLAQTAEPLMEPIDHPLVSLPPTKPMPNGNYLLLITPEDCQPEMVGSSLPSDVLGLVPALDPNHSEHIHAFQHGAVSDAVSRSVDTAATVAIAEDWAAVLIKAAERSGTRQIVTPWAAGGPIADQLDAVKDALAAAGVHLHQHQRRYDTLTWPHATKGFFKLKKKIPAILDDLGLKEPPYSESATQYPAGK